MLSFNETFSLASLITAEFLSYNPTEYLSETYSFHTHQLLFYIFPSFEEASSTLKQNFFLFCLIKMKLSYLMASLIKDAKYRDVCFYFYFERPEIDFRENLGRSNFGLPGGHVSVFFFWTCKPD